MSVKPILFNTEMVRAILDGRKTVTRRVIWHPQPMIGSTIYPNIDVAGKVCAEIWGNGTVNHIKQQYCLGDILWVRETWAQRSQGNYLYRAAPHGFGTPEQQDEAMRGLGLKWRPSIHMPREVARIFLRVTDVRVERLQEITWQQAAAEGCQGEACDELEPRNDGLLELPTLLGAFRDLWDSSIIKPADRERYGWAANPWVWVIEFEKCKKPEEDA